jgi:hypothetical protein
LSSEARVLDLGCGEGKWYPSEILPFEYFYSKEADLTFNLCAIERTVFICKGKLEREISDEEMNDVEKCAETAEYDL